MKKKSSTPCRHKHPQDIGSAAYGLANAQWCPMCGAKRERMINWPNRSKLWIMPKRKGSVVLWTVQVRGQNFPSSIFYRTREKAEKAMRKDMQSFHPPAEHEIVKVTIRFD